LLGVGKLENREDPRILGTEKEVTLYNPSESLGSFYKDFALDCSRQQIAVDLFLFPSAFIDVATLGVLPQITGGELFYYPGFNAEKHSFQVMADIQKDITRYTSWEGVMRIRCSKGLKIAAHHGNFFIRSTDLLAIPNTDEDKAFAFQLQLTENLTGTKYGAIQSAVLYTNSTGERRIRVQTLSIPITNTIPDLFRNADCGAITNLIAKMAIDKIQTTKLSDAREAIVNKCVDILAVYRDTFGTAGAGNPAPATTQPGQLLIPENLRLLPLYVLALAKSPLFRPIDVRPDERVFHLHRFKTLPVDPSLNFIYPSLFNVNALTYDTAHTLPAVLNLSSEKLERRNMYLMDNNLTLTLYIPKQVNPAVIYEVFGVDQLALVEPGPTRLPVLNTELNNNLRNLITLLERRANKVMRLDVIREGDPAEPVFLINLIEDRNRAITSYYEFMVQLQRSVAAKTKS
jgi:protein transport protein SEC24